MDDVDEDTEESLSAQESEGAGWQPLLEEQSQDSTRDSICQGFSSREFADFSEEQLITLKNLGWEKLTDDRLERYKTETSNFLLVCEWATADYLKEKILMARTKKPKNLFLYIKKMIENDK